MFFFLKLDSSQLSINRKSKSIAQDEYACFAGNNNKDNKHFSKEKTEIVVKAIISHTEDFYLNIVTYIYYLSRFALFGG